MINSENKSSLYIGDLSAQTTQTDLYTFFGKYGNVVSIQHNKRKNEEGTGLKPYAKVTYENEEMGQKAYDTLTAAPVSLGGSFIRVMFYNRNIPKVDNCNIFVKNVDPTIHSAELTQFCAQFGDIVSAKICYDEKAGKQVSKGYGFIQFKEPESATTAIEFINKRESESLSSPLLHAEMFIPKSQRSLENNFCNIYVRGFEENYTEGEMVAFFSSYGKITSTCLMKNEKGESKKFGFVCYEQKEVASQVVAELHGKEINEITWFVARAMSKRERSIENYKTYKAKVEDWKKRNLFVRNLDDSIDSGRLKSIFQEYGDVTSTKVASKDSIYFDTEAIMQNKQSSRGYGYVCFATPQQAKTALEKLNHMEVEGKKIFVEWWLPRNEIMQRKRRLPRSKNLMLGNLGFPQMPPMMPNMPMPMPGMMPPMQYPMMPGGMIPPMMAPGNMRMPGGPQNRPYPQNRGPRQPPRNTPLPPQFNNFANLDKEKRNQLVGDFVFPKIQARHGEYAGKLTGMILGLDTEELLHMVKDENALFQRADEALKVLKEHAATN